jgi:Cu(I)/Ag(I) efflux system membrane fusion protein
MSLRPGTVLVLATVAIVAYTAGRWRRPTVPAASARRVLYYHDPMHPAYRSDRPGVAPDCGMQLEPVYAGADPPVPPGAVHISPDQQRLVGVSTVEVQRQAGNHLVRLPGRVTADESRIFRVSTRVEGWVRQIHPSTTGSRVHKGQPLVSVYGREYRMAQQSYIYALNALGAPGRTAEPGLDQSKLTVSETRANLESLGIDAAQIEEIGRSRQPQLEVRLVAPADGVIVTRNVTPNQKFEIGTELYRVVDLRRVWVVANISSSENAHVHPGARVRVVPPGDRGGALPAQVSDSLPSFDRASGTLEVRLEVDNPGLVLKPEMLVDVELSADLPEALSVPGDAVVDSGLEESVFVDAGQGLFARRPVRVGWRLGGRVEILEGLRPGERVVAAGLFLVDAESRLKDAAVTRDPVCGMSVDPRSAPRVEFEGRTYYFCSDRCKHQMQQSPQRYRREGT